MHSIYLIYLHALFTCSIYTLYLHALFTCSIYTLYLQEYAWPFFTQLPVPTDYTPPPGKALESKVFTYFTFSEM